MSTFTLNISLPDGKILPLSVDELKEKFEVIEMPITLMCAGYRRSEFNAQVKDKKVNVRNLHHAHFSNFFRVFHGANALFPQQDGKAFFWQISSSTLEFHTKIAGLRDWFICALKGLTLVLMESAQELLFHSSEHLTALPPSSSRLK